MTTIQALPSGGFKVLPKRDAKSFQPCCPICKFPMKLECPENLRVTWDEWRCYSGTTAKVRSWHDVRLMIERSEPDAP